MDEKFTEKIRAWLESPADERDYAAGALMVLQLSNKQHLYRSLMANPKAKAQHIEYQLQKYYNFRVADLTHKQVRQMEAQADEAVARNLSVSEEYEAETHRKGRRADHDSLPPEIIALYDENLALVRRMREVHVRLKLLSTENVTCPDSERYPFVKEIIALDKKLRQNWYEYDHYKAGAKEEGAAPKRVTRTRKTAKK